MGHVYDDHFMDYTDASSRHSARSIAGLLREALTIDSVLDVGCARGTWLAAWRDLGATVTHGADGDYVDREKLAVPADCFHSADLSRPLQIGQRFDLVQSLEVAEHIDAKHAEQFVANLVNHSNGLILFSAAPPGQGGEFHVNEKPYDYWRGLFAAHGYHAYDFVRPRILDDVSISFWYRFNILLYVRKDQEADLPANVRATRLKPDQAVPDVSPPLFRLRKRLVRSLPYSLQQLMARIKARCWPSGRF